jgi:hypothetical protein
MPARRVRVTGKLVDGASYLKPIIVPARGRFISSAGLCWLLSESPTHLCDDVVSSASNGTNHRTLAEYFLFSRTRLSSP